MTGLPRTSPSKVGVDATGVTAFLEALDSAPDIEPHSLMLVCHGKVAAEGWWDPFSQDRVHLLYSLSKSFTSAAVGLAVDEGLMDLDATVLSYFPELNAQITDQRSRSMRVRHIAAMASGHRGDTIERARAADPVDLVRGFLSIPPDEEPGSVFAYNQPCTYTLGAIVQRVSGMTLIDFLRPRLFEPLGIGPTGWTQDQLGRNIGYSGLHAATEAVAKLGLLHLQNGRWDGRQLLPSSWVQLATHQQVATPAESNPDWREGYGFQFWMGRHGYRGDGAYGQFCIVLPEHDVVVAITSRTPDMQAVLNLVWKHLLPAFGRSPDSLSEAGDTELARRLAGLSVPPAAGGGRIPTWFTGQRFEAGAGNDQPSVTDVVVTSTDIDGWTVRLMGEPTPISAELGFGRWVTTDAVAASSAWIEPVTTGDGAYLRIELLFVETPHRLRLTCRPDDGRFETQWMTPLLHPTPLAALRMPANRPLSPE